VGSQDGVEGSGDEPIHEAAAAWVARLSSSDATDADRAAFAAWRDADPAHAGAYAEMDALWHHLGRLPDPRRRRPPTTLAGIAVVALAGGVLAYQLGLLDRLRADLWSGVGDIAHATLADGSRVDLNTDTAIALRFTDRERRVDLLRGEASFDVVPDPDRPFIVEGGGVSVRAVGTRFSVRADGAPDPVEVAQGRVDVATSHRRVSVSAGEVAHIGENASLAVTSGDVSRHLAWRDGRLIFAGQPLSTVLVELGRYRHGRILLLDGRLGQRRVTGAFEAGNTDDALAVIAATMGARIRRLSPLIVLVGSPL